MSFPLNSQMKPGIKKTLRIFFILICIGIMALYLLACLVPFLDAGKYWVVTLLGLLFPFLFLFLLLLFLYFIFRKMKWAVICGAVLLIGLRQISVFFSFGVPSKFNASIAPGNIRVMTWNLSSWGESNRKV
mgnify:FL=1